jgi:dTDP-4-amino-4,6-dideoxygalactose transaminase
MKAIRSIADRHGLLIVEDNAQGIGARGDGFRIGELSDAVCTSFIIQKNLGCFGDGGAVITNHEKVDRAIRKLRNHGSDKRSCHSMGYNSRLDDIHAGVLSVKLKRIDEWNDLRRKWAARYSSCLRDARSFTLPYETPGSYHVYHLYVIETKKPEHRDPLLNYLNENGIDAKCHYPIAIHQQEGYPWGKQARIAGAIPNSERNAACCISLPMFPELTDQEVDYVIDRVLEWDRKADVA